MSSRIALHRVHRVIAVDLVPERIERTRRHGIEVVDARDYDDGNGGVPEAIREMTDSGGRTR